MLKHKFFIWNRSNHYGAIANAVVALFIISTLRVIADLDIIFISTFASLVLSYYALMMLWQILLNGLNGEIFPNLKRQNKNVYETGLYRPERKDITDEER